MKDNERRIWLRQITHQLMSPLHGIQGYADLTLFTLERWKELRPDYFSHWKKKDLQKLERQLEAIKFSSRYAARMLRNLALYLPFDMQGNLDLVLIEDAAGFIVKTVRDFQPMARLRGVKRLYVDTNSILKLNNHLLVNPNLFQQAIENLIDNAIKYSDKNTEIVIEGAIIEQRAQIIIINFGIPLLPEETEKIFLEYYRSDNASIRYPSGTGIGLTVSRAIIELFGGTLTALPSSNINDGWKTTFIITLPLHQDM